MDPRVLLIRTVARLSLRFCDLGSRLLLGNTVIARAVENQSA